MQRIGAAMRCVGATKDPAKMTGSKMALKTRDCGPHAAGTTSAISRPHLGLISGRDRPAPRGAEHTVDAGDASARLAARAPAAGRSPLSAPCPPPPAQLRLAATRPRVSFSTSASGATRAPPRPRRPPARAAAQTRAPCAPCAGRARPIDAHRPNCSPCSRAARGAAGARRAPRAVRCRPIAERAARCAAEHQQAVHPRMLTAAAPLTGPERGHASSVRGMLARVGAHLDAGLTRRRVRRDSGTRAPPRLHEARHAAPPSRHATPGRLGRRREADAARRQRRAALRQHARRDRARSRLTRAQHPSAVPTNFVGRRRPSRVYSVVAPK